MKCILIILLILLCAAPVAAVTYSPEYYTLSYNSDAWYNSIISSSLFPDRYDKTSAGTFIELRRQTILMEKQNDLQAEFVKLQWVETCYAPKYGVKTVGNYSAWKLECANAGYPVD